MAVSSSREGTLALLGLAAGVGAVGGWLARLAYHPGTPAQEEPAPWEAPKRPSEKAGNVGHEGGAGKSRREWRSRMCSAERHKAVTVTAASLKEFETLLASRLKPGDRVLDVAHHEGGKVVSYEKTLASIVGPSGRVIQLDPAALHTHGAVFSCATETGPIRAICIDVCMVHGNDMVLELLRLISLLLECFLPEVVLVKSRELTRHALKTAPALTFIRLKAKDPKWKWKPPSGRKQVSTQVLAAYGVDAYRQTIPIIVGQGGCRRILEIGCHMGCTTRMIYDAVVEAAGQDEASDAPLVKGVDTGAQVLKIAVKQGPADIQYMHASGWDTHALTQLCSDWQAIYVDIGGLSGTDGVLEAIALIRQLEMSFSPSLRFVVIKSKCMQDHATFCRAAFQDQRAMASDKREEEVKELRRLAKGDHASASADSTTPRARQLEPDADATATMTHFYPVGKPGQAWGDDERAEWLKLAGIVKRSYEGEVLSKLEPLRHKFDIEQYGALSQDPARYPLFVVKTRDWDVAKPCVLVTGGTHGYETSGVQGALLFAATEMAKYTQHFNIAVCPCVSPWSYECIQRWNAKTIDPNRSYVVDSPCEECAAIMNWVDTMAVPQWTMHLDLHETTDTDLSEFFPAKASRDGLALAEDEVIPDGFYFIGNVDLPQHDWHNAMIDGVRKVTHIAPADIDGNIIGMRMSQEGVTNSKSPGKGKGITNAEFATTTEVYPDSRAQPVTGEQCNRAQVAAIVAGLDYILAGLPPRPSTIRRSTLTGWPSLGT